ncbi:MAG: hypothetical protein WEA61_05560 [Anaerolineales bacterium]
MKGDKVIVRTYGGKPVVCKVWEVTPEVVAVCSEENFETLERGEQGLWPVGIPREDVFFFAPNVKDASWERLKQYA